MRKLIMLMPFICVGVVLTNSQIKAPNNTTHWVKYQNASDSFKWIPMIVDNKIIENPIECIIGFGSTKGIELINPSDIRAKPYGVRARKGLILVTLQDSVKLIGLPELLDRYNIKQGDRGLKVCVDESLVEHPDRLLADPSAISGIEIKTGKYWNWDRSYQSLNEARFIDIKFKVR